MATFKRAINLQRVVVKGRADPEAKVWEIYIGTDGKGVVVRIDVFGCLADVSVAREPKSAEWCTFLQPEVKLKYSVAS